jgi:hypothetical protein
MTCNLRTELIKLEQLNMAKRSYKPLSYSCIFISLDLKNRSVRFFDEPVDNVFLLTTSDCISIILFRFLKSDSETCQ